MTHIRVRPAPGLLLFSERFAAIHAKLAKLEQGPTPSQRLAAAKKEVKRLSLEEKNVTDQQFALAAGLATLSEPEAIAAAQAELLRVVELLEELTRQKVAADAELEAAGAAKREEDAEKARRKQAREELQAQQAIDGLEKAWTVFLEEFPGADLEDYYVYAQERERIRVEEANWEALGHSKETWNLWKGNEYAAEDKIRKQQQGREEAFDEWPLYKETMEFRIKMASQLKKLLEKQATRIQEKPAKLQQQILELGGSSDPQRETKLQKKTAELAVANLDVANVLPAVTAETAQIAAFLATVESERAEATALSKFLQEYNFQGAQGALPSDWPAYRDERTRREQERQDYLSRAGSVEETWLLEFGNRYRAEEEVRKTLDNRGAAFDEWEERKVDLGEEIDSAERRILAVRMTKLKKRIVTAQGALEAELAQGSDAGQALLGMLQTRLATETAAVNVLLPLLEARLRAIDAAKDATKLAAKEAAQAKKQEARELERSEAAAAREAKKQERLAEMAAAKAEKDAERAATVAEKERLREEARQARLAAAAARKETLRAKQAEVKAKKEAKAQGRRELFEARLEEVKREAEDVPARIAAATLVLDAERVRLQNKFDAMPILGVADDEPPQPRESRGSLGSWPVCQVPLSDNQHLNLFLTESEIWPENDENDDNDDNDASSLASSTPGDVVMAMADANADTAASVCMLERLKLQADFGAPLSEASLYSADPLIFNKPYARRLLTAHLQSLYDINTAATKTNPKAKYVGVWSALGTDPASAVEQLLPQWEQLLRYRNTMLKVKELQLEQDLELITALDTGRASAVKKGLDAIRKHKMKPQWTIEARRLAEADRGQLPGQLFTPQPHFLPLRIAAPPRVGKSATALLMATLAKRAGMKTVYSVSPNKNTPIQEMQTKLIRIGWRDEDEAREVDRLVSETFKDYKENVACLQMKYSHFVIDNVPGKSKAAPDYRKIDMILYSSDVPEDCQRMGAVLADWRYRDAVVFHIRDEAQSLAKALENNVVPAHGRDVPPPVELQYLRHYYGNHYGLNCNVTATHFPTLLEEDMWGFLGSVRQNSRAGLPLSAGVQKISAQLGSNFLPTLVPALLPVVSDGYIGVAALRTWAPRGVPVELQMGASHSGVDDNTGELRRAIDATPPVPAGGGRSKKKAAAVVPKLTRAQRAENRRKTLEGGLDEEEQAEAKANAVRDAQVGIDEVIRRGDPDYIPGDEEDEEDEEEEERVGAKKKGLTKAEKKAKKDAEIAERERKTAADIDAIQNHFAEFMTKEDANESNINAWRAPGEAQDPAMSPGVRQVNLIPMYIGALNTDISDTGMASFIRVFGRIAHTLAVSAGATKGQKTTKKMREHGVAFLLFTTALENRDDVEASAIKLADDAPLPKLPLPAAPSAGAPPACEPVAERKKMSALCCVYNPQDAKNKALSEGNEPFFNAFFVSSAEVAVEEVWAKLGISKIAILGYGMLQAGLTVQTVDNVEGQPLRIYCPKYVALATAENAALDAQLQIAGRSFVELKGQTAPTAWTIELLGVRGMVERLNRYSDMEGLLARIRGKRMFEALKEGFGAKMMVANSLGTLGVVGTRRGDFSGILGMTPAEALKRANVAARVREE